MIQQLPSQVYNQEKSKHLLTQKPILTNLNNNIQKHPKWEKSAHQLKNKNTMFINKSYLTIKMNEVVMSGTT